MVISLCQPAFRMLVIFDHLVDSLVRAARWSSRNAHYDVMAAAVVGEHRVAQPHKLRRKMPGHTRVEVSAVAMHDKDGTFASVDFRLVKGPIKRIGAGFD